MVLQTSKKNVYWICQLGGWLFYILLNSLFIGLSNAFNTNVALSMLILLMFGVLLSHLYRNIIIRFGWLKTKILFLIPRVIIATVLFAMVLEYSKYYVELLLHIAGNSHRFTLTIAETIINFAFVFFFWSLFYFIFHYIENYKKAEIENLKWKVSINEIELNKFKSQLNPHFMFNAMNSIRALVDENPDKSKIAITQLSNILRNTLQMGKNKVIPFDEELKIVNDYLALESIRYEERLKTRMEIHPESKNFFVPPLMIQTMVENGIKHGIAKLTQGGMLVLTTIAANDKLIIEIKNSGQLKEENESDSGFGIKNTLQRMQLLYSNEALLKMVNIDENNVLTQLIIPKKLFTNESDFDR